MTIPPPCGRRAAARHAPAAKPDPPDAEQRHGDPVDARRAAAAQRDEEGHRERGDRRRAGPGRGRRAAPRRAAPSSAAKPASRAGCARASRSGRARRGRAPPSSSSAIANSEPAAPDERAPRRRAPGRRRDPRAQLRAPPLAAAASRGRWTGAGGAAGRSRATLPAAIAAPRSAYSASDSSKASRVKSGQSSSRKTSSEYADCQSR